MLLLFTWTQMRGGNEYYNFIGQICSIKQSGVEQNKENISDKFNREIRFIQPAPNRWNKHGLMMHDNDDDQFLFPANLREMKGKKKSFILFSCL